jgi:hypothetical protein
VAPLSQGRTAAAQCGLFTHKSVPVIFEPPCTFIKEEPIIKINYVYSVFLTGNENSIELVIICRSARHFIYTRGHCCWDTEDVLCVLNHTNGT